MVTKTFHGAGIVVPVDKNDVGYRELPETDGELIYCICITINLDVGKDVFATCLFVFLPPRLLLKANLFTVI